jgi:hypothetical protein
MNALTKPAELKTNPLSTSIQLDPTISITQSQLVTEILSNQVRDRMAIELEHLFPSHIESGENRCHGAGLSRTWRAA